MPPEQEDPDFVVSEEGDYPLVSHLMSSERSLMNEWIRRAWGSAILRSSSETIFGHTIGDEELAYAMGQFAARHDPLFSAIASRTLERDRASSRTVVQGSLAYASADEFPSMVERFIPVDIYSEDGDPESAVTVARAIIKLTRALRFGFVLHPGIARSSTHLRGAIQTAPMTAEQLKETEENLAVVLLGLDSANASDTEDPASLKRENEALIKLLEAQLAKPKPEADDKQKEADLSKTKAETGKIWAETFSVAMEAVQKLSKAMLTASLGVSIIIGTTALSSSSSEPKGQAPEPGKKEIRATKTDKKTNLARLAEFLTKLAEQEEAAAKLSGGE